MRSSVLSPILCWVVILLQFGEQEAALLLKDAAARPKFEFYKNKFKKKYKTELDEHQAYVNFVNNWNELEKLNGISTKANETYQLNSFADLSPVYVHKHYAVNITPSCPGGDTAGTSYVFSRSQASMEVFYSSSFSRHSDDNELGETMAAKALRQSKQRADNVKLYDLDDAEDLYKRFLKKYRKPKYSKTKHSWRFLKFVQTLGKINRHNLLNNDKMTYDIHADELKEPKRITFE